MAVKAQTAVSIRTLWGLAKCPQLGLTDEELHLFVAAHTGKDSIRELNKSELRMLIRVLGNMKESAGKPGDGRKRPRGNPATENQRRKIYMLARELGWYNPARVNGLCRKMFQVERVEWLDSMQCAKLIEALKSMGKRQEGDGLDGKA